MPSMRSLHTFYFFLMIGGLIPMLVNGPNDFRDYVEDRSQLTNVIYAFIHFIYFTFFIYLFKIRKNTLFALMLPIAFILLSLIQTFYSQDILRSSVIMAFLILQMIACIFIFESLTYEDFLASFAKACFITAVLCLLFIVLIPSYGKMTYVFPGAWQGVFVTKNVLGRFAVLSFIVFLSYSHSDGFGKFCVTGLAMSIVLVVGSGSATALIVSSIILGCYIFIKYDISRLFVVLLFILLIYLSTFAELEMNGALSAMGKSATLSGRTTIWSLVWPDILSHPYLGYGLGAFWQTSDAENIRNVTGWFVPHAHNGLLELGLQTGLVGMTGFTLILILMFRRSFVLLRIPSIRFNIFPLLFSIHCVGYGFGEANYFRANSFVQILIYAVIYYGYIEYIRAKISSPQQKSTDRNPIDEI